MVEGTVAAAEREVVARVAAVREVTAMGVA